MTEDALPPVVRSLLAAVEANPEDSLLRLHVAELMLQHDPPAAAARQCSEVLAKDPTDTVALRLLGAATEALRGGPGEAGLAPPAFVEADAAPDVLEHAQNTDVMAFLTPMNNPELRKLYGRSPAPD